MSKKLLLFLFFFIVSQTCFSQVSSLPTKAVLSESLLSNIQFTGSGGVDTLVLNKALPARYTLEWVTTLNSVTGRGLDVEGRNGDKMGFRLSLGADLLQYSAPLSAPTPLATSRTAEEQVIRVAVTKDTAYIFKNGVFIYAHPLSEIKDIINGVEGDGAIEVVDPTNLVSNWGGADAADNSGLPTDYGWDFSGSAPFNTANSGSGVRYMDNLSSLNYNGSTYQGRSMYIRWDGGGYTNGIYTYPVTLEANTTYDFSMLYAYVTNYNGTNTGSAGYTHGNALMVGVGSSQDIADRYDSIVFNPSVSGTLQNSHFSFTSNQAGVYYLSIGGPWALYAIADLRVNKVATPEPRIILGKNYTEGAVDISLSSLRYEPEAYAPASSVSPSRTTQVISEGSVYIPTAFNTDFQLTGKVDAHFNGALVPIANGSIAINSDQAWLFIDNIKPTTVIKDWLSTISVNGEPADTSTNIRIGEYVNGTVIIPHGKQNDQMAITFFTGENFTGDSVNYEIFDLHNDLGVYDNQFKSFKLRRGYMATIGSNPLGLGFSKVYIADMDELQVPVLPKGLYSKTSFIRAFRWEYVSKKGWAGGGTPLEMVNATWNYDWSASGNSTLNTNYTPIRQNGGWPSFNEIYNKRNSNHLLGFNEPDHTDQANMTVDEALQQWPQLLKSGFRLGSPAPSSPNSWLQQFMRKADSLNYRVDFVAVHCYWNSRVSGGHADAWYNGLLNTYNNWGKRPIWITEWNNGANWTGEYWPANEEDAFNKQASELPLILQVLDTTSFVERYAIYNWVEDKRAMVLADSLTPAGKIYAANKSRLAFSSDPDVYKPADMYEHTWRIAAPILRYHLSDDYSKAVINWLDINGDLGVKYVLERAINDEGTFSKIAEFNFETDYPEGSTLTFSDDINYDKASYRLYAISYEGDSSWYSASLVVNRDQVATPPSLLTSVVSATQLRLSWVFNGEARSYRLQRSLSGTDGFQTIADFLTDSFYVDKNLDPATTYYYRLAGINSAGVGDYSATVQIATPALTVPDTVASFFVGSGDMRASLTWAGFYDAHYTILRSLSLEGNYDTIARDLSVTRYVDEGLNNGDSYYYKIYAYNDAGIGEKSAAFEALPQVGQFINFDFGQAADQAIRDHWGAYDATLMNGASIVSNGDGSGNALKLDPTLQSYVQLSDGILSDLHDFTIESYVYFPSDIAMNNARLFDFGSNTGNFMVFMPFVSGGVRYKITCATGTDDRTMPVTIPSGKWVRLVLSQNDNVFKMYLDGNLSYVDSVASVSPSEMGFTTANYLGKSQFGSDPYGNFTMDDFKVYNYAMTDAEVMALENNTALPVGVTGFKASPYKNNSVLLRWKAEGDISGAYFLLERSSDGIHYNPLAKIEASLEYARPVDYNYVDATQLSGLQYYKLTKVARDGRSEIVGITKLLTSSNLGQVLIYPNPLSGNKLTLNYNSSLNAKSSKLMVRIVDGAGRLCYKKQLEKVVGGKYILEGLNLASGIYYVLIDGAERATFIKK